MHGRITYSYSIAAGASAASGARVTPSGVKTVRIASTNPVWFTYGTAAQIAASPAAVGSGVYLNNTLSEYFEVAAGDVFSVISAGTAGTVTIAEMSK